MCCTSQMNKLTSFCHNVVKVAVDLRGDHFDNVLMKFITKNRAHALKTDENFFLQIFILLLLKVSQCTSENFCGFCKTKLVFHCTFVFSIVFAWFKYHDTSSLKITTLILMNI